MKRKCIIILAVMAVLLSMALPASAKSSADIPDSEAHRMIHAVETEAFRQMGIDLRIRIVDEESDAEALAAALLDSITAETPELKDHAAIVCCTYDNTYAAVLGETNEKLTYNERELNKLLKPLADGEVFLPERILTVLNSLLDDLIDKEGADAWKDNPLIDSYLAHRDRAKAFRDINTGNKVAVFVSAALLSAIAITAAMLFFYKKSEGRRNPVWMILAVTAAAAAVLICMIATSSSERAQDRDDREVEVQTVPGTAKILGSSALKPMLVTDAGTVTFTDSARASHIYQFAGISVKDWWGMVGDSMPGTFTRYADKDTAVKMMDFYEDYYYMYRGVHEGSERILKRINGGNFTLLVTGEDHRDESRAIDVSGRRFYLRVDEAVYIFGIERSTYVEAYRQLFKGLGLDPELLLGNLKIK